MIDLKDVSFAYSGGREDAGLKHINLHIDDGESVLLCGKSGCGKTTLTRLINGLIPRYYEGTLEGSVMVDGKHVPECELYDMAQSVGSVFQNPGSQFFNVDTTGELIFGCENLGMPSEEISCRLGRTVKALSLEPLMDRSIFSLSGGEKQRIACGSIDTLAPEIVLLDEPTSNLDFEGIRALQEIIGKWKIAGKTIVVAEHRIHFMNGLADRILYMENGEICEEYSGREFFEKPKRFFETHGLRIPSIDRLDGEGTNGNTTGEASQSLRVKNFCYAYSGQKRVLDIQEAELPDGICAIIGHNGAGKTTFVRSLCGLLKRDKGTLFCRGRELNAKLRLSACYLVFQDADHQLFTESVMDETLLSMDREDEEKASEILDKLDLTPFRQVHPMSLSGGQKQRVAIASAIASGREIPVFDEPTAGLDYTHMKQTATAIAKLRESGVIVFVVTHDPEFILSCCTDILHIEDGRIAACYPLDQSGKAKLQAFFAKPAVHSCVTEDYEWKAKEMGENGV